nr:HAD family hydrolase [uncultured Cohaesibacter sp.]
MAELGISDKVDVVVSEFEIPKGKQHPLPYLMTVRALGLEPHNACAFEVSLPGARSAHAADLTVFAIGERCSQAEFNFCAATAETYKTLLAPLESPNADGK